MTNPEKIVKHKIGLLNLAEELGNISQACKLIGYSRQSFYEYKNLYQTGGIEALFEKNRQKPNLKNRVPMEIENAVKDFAIQNPAYGQLRVSNELKKQGLFVSPGGVRSIWQRYELETMKKRLKALEEKVAKENLILTEAQLIALEKAKEEKQAIGEIETEHPGYLGSQDTFYVGTLKGVGRIYQQTFIDTYCKTGFAKLYTMKSAITSADLLNDRVVPFYDKHEIPILRVLTDRGTEYCGKIENHEYELYLAIEGIDHSKTKVKNPQSNGICERFHRTILDEFYRVAFRKKIYHTLEELQNDLDEWMKFYNEERTHSGKYCFGKTPMQTFLDTKHLAKEKMLDNILQDNEQPLAV
jgi:transposase InsO family protein